MEKAAFEAFSPVFSSPFFSLEEARSTSGTEPYYRIAGPDSAIICLLNTRAEILMVKQFRPNLLMETLEFPAGAIEASETPVQAASREVLEETGLHCGVVQLGQFFRLMMNRTSIRDYLFVGLAQSETGNGEQKAELECFWISRSELMEMSLTGGYQQLAGLGILNLLTLSMGEDFWTMPSEKLVASVSELIDSDVD